LTGFNAKMRANNFTLPDLPSVMAFLHGHGVRGYLTMNTLVFVDELAAVGEQLRSIAAADLDAVIVQDIGLCHMIRNLSRDFPIHASTQMTLTSTAGIDHAKELRVNLAVWLFWPRNVPWWIFGPFKKATANACSLKYSSTELSVLLIRGNA